MVRWLTLFLLGLLAAGCGSGAGSERADSDASRSQGGGAVSARSQSAGRIPTPGLYRAGTGGWYILEDYGPEGPRADAQFVYGGDAGDLPVVGDWDGDGGLDEGVYRRTTGRWYLLTVRNAAGPVADLKFTYGGDPSDLPVIGDFDGDGRDDPGLYRQVTGTWYLLTGREGEQPVSDLQIAFAGSAEAMPAVGDFDGDGRSDLALFDRSNGRWRLDLDRDGQTDLSFIYGGAPGDLAVVGDFDGNGVDDPGVYRQGTGWWYLLTGRDASGPVSDVQIMYGGDPSDVPMVGDFTGDGASDLGLYRRNTGGMYLLTVRNGNQTVEDIKITYGGDPSDLPLVPAPLLAPLRPYPGDLPDSMIVELAVEPAALTLPHGRTHALVARARYMDGSWRDVTARALWSTSQPAIVSVTPDGAAKALRSSGSSTVEARLAGHVGQSSVTCAAAAVDSLSILPESPVVPLGSQRTFQVFAHMSSGGIGTVGADSWSTTHPIVAPMVAAGTFQGMALGTSTIRAEYRGLQVETVMTVTQAVVSSVRLTPERPLEPTGEQVRFRALATYTDGIERDVTGTAVWTSSAATVASIGSSGGPDPGLAEALVPGSTTITARDPGTSLSATTRLVVTETEQVGYERNLVGGMGTNAEGSRLLVHVGGRVHAYDSGTLEVVQTWNLPSGLHNPVSFSTDGRYAAAPQNTSVSQVSVLDMQTGIRRAVRLSFRPVDTVFGERNRLYVLGEGPDGRSLMAVDTTTWSEVASRSWNSSHARYLAYSASQDRLLITNSGTSPNGLSVLDSSTDALPQVAHEHRDLPGQDLFVTGDGQEVLSVTSSQVSFRSVANPATITRSWPGGGLATWYDLRGAVGKFYRLLTGHVTVEDSTTLQELDRISVAVNPADQHVLRRFQVSGDGRAMAVYATAHDSTIGDPLLLLFDLSP